MSTIKVLGIGSPFGDDQVGWKAIEILRQRDTFQRYIPRFLHMESYDRPGVRLLELMQGAKIIFLIDAVVTGNAIGTLYRFQNKEIEELKCLLSTHDIGVAQTLQLGRVLDQLPDNIIFYGIEINSENSGKNISSLIEPTLNQLIEYVENEVIEILNSIK
jgi:hydrogenase maturation protease